METWMAIKRVSKLNLFQENAPLPLWQDFEEKTRTEALNLLAQLLLSLCGESPVDALRDQGARDE
jgi:hypothetical protein